LRLLQFRLGSSHGRFCLIELCLVGILLDDEEDGVLLYQSPVLITDLIQKALHAGLKIDLVEGLRIACQLDIAGHRLLQRLLDDHLWRRWWSVEVLFFAGGQREKCRAAGGDARGCSRASARHRVRCAGTGTRLHADIDCCSCRSHVRPLACHWTAPASCYSWLRRNRLA